MTLRLSLRRRLVDLLIALLGPRRVGALEFHLRPGLRPSWGGPFNGQKRREEIILSILRRVPVTAIVETGTFRGTTTEWFARHSRARIFTVESDPRFFGFAAERLRRHKHVRVTLGDSRVFLRDLVSGGRIAAGAWVLFYLDAHWQEDVPLMTELTEVFSCQMRPVVVIDDFQVPDDQGYGFDSYEGTGPLCLALVAPVLRDHGLCAFFPAAASGEEGGMRRGSVVLAREPDAREALRDCRELRFHAAATDADPLGASPPGAQPIGEIRAKDSSSQRDA